MMVFIVEPNLESMQYFCQIILMQVHMTHHRAYYVKHDVIHTFGSTIEKLQYF